MNQRMHARLLDSNGYKWSCELFIGNKWFATLGGFDTEDEAVLHTDAVSSRWNACEDVLAALDKIDSLREADGPARGQVRGARHILRRAINGEG